MKNKNTAAGTYFPISATHRARSSVRRLCANEQRGSMNESDHGALVRLVLFLGVCSILAALVYSVVTP